jgi:hypothetical protein
MAAIASEIGFESEAAFSRSFKRTMGVTPSAWRQGVRSAKKLAGQFVLPRPEPKRGPGGNCHDHTPSISEGGRRCVSGIVFCSCGLLQAAQAQQPLGQTLPVMVGGKRVRTIDVHAHCQYEAGALLGADAAVVAHDQCWERHEIDASPIRTLGIRRRPAYSGLGLDGNGHRTLVVFPCDAPAISTYRRHESREALRRLAR